MLPQPFQLVLECILSGDLMQVMPRKFRLSVHRKNEFRKACASTVSVQRASVAPAAVSVDQSTSLKSIGELKVSVPIDLVCDFEVSTVAKLRERVKTLSPLPQGTSFIGYALILTFFCLS